MATTDQQTRSTSRHSAEDADRGAPAWPTRDLERRGGRQADATETPTANAPDDMSPAASMTEPMTPETTMKTATEPAARPATSRTTSFLADLTRAMRTAAESERSDVLARFRQDAEAFVESMRGEFSAAADAYRSRCDTDVASIEAWCEAELERIRRETEEGIAQRRARLEADLAAQTTRLEEGVSQVGSTVDAFEGDMASFFARLLAEEDPSTFAVMARHLPEAPAFAPWPAEATAESEAWTAPSTGQSHLDIDALAAAEAEAAAGLETEGFATASTTSTAMTVAAPAATDAATDAAPARMVVAAIGLVSVASVSSFKRALAHAEGVHAVQVSSGPQGEFLFNLTCDPGVDLTSLVGALPGFEVEVRGTAPGAVTIVAHDLDSEG